MASTTTTHKSMSTIGLKNVVIAQMTTEDSDTAAAVYGDIVKVAGAISAQVSPGNSDPDIQYADDDEYDVLYADPENSVTMEFAALSLECQALLMGSTIGTNGVMTKNYADFTKRYFALGFMSEKSDHTFRYVWFPKCRVAPIEENYGTKEGTTINRQTQSVTFTAIKLKNNGDYQYVLDTTKTSSEAANTTAKTFLDSVYVKPAVASGGT